MLKIKFGCTNLIILFPDGRTLPINRKQKVFPNGTLIIENVERQSDQATYTCVVQNEQGFLVKGNLEVQVMGKSKSSTVVQTIASLSNLIMFSKNI